MREDIAGPQGASSRPMWETLEGVHPTDHGGGSHGVVRPGEVRAQEYGGLGRGLPQRIWQAEAAYRRTDLIERRRRLMDDWAAYLSGEPRESSPNSP